MTRQLEWVPENPTDKDFRAFCIHQGKVNCGFCREIFEKPLMEHVYEDYVARCVGSEGRLALYWILKGWSERKQYSIEV